MIRDHLRVINSIQHTDYLENFEFHVSYLLYICVKIISTFSLSHLIFKAIIIPEHFLFD